MKISKWHLIHILNSRISDDFIQMDVTLLKLWQSHPVTQIHFEFHQEIDLRQIKTKQTKKKPTKPPKQPIKKAPPKNNQTNKNQTKPKKQTARAAQNP